MTKHLRLIMLSLLAMICLGGYSQSKGPEVTLDFSDYKGNPWDISTSSYCKETKTYTNGTYKIILTPGEEKGFMLSNYKGTGYLQMGKKNASITLPAFNFDVEKIVVVAPPSGQGNKSVTQNVYVDKVAVSTQTTGCQSNKEYQINEEYQKSGNRYVIKVTNGYLTYMSKIQIYKKQGSGKTATTLSFKDLVGKGVTLINGKLENGNDFKGYTATEKDNVAGTIAYAADPRDGVATVDANTGTVTVTPNVYGKTTITATFTPTHAEIYAESTASYTVINERTPTTITFGSGVDNNTFEVKDGEIVETRVATVTPVGATGSIVYESSDKAIAKVDATTGAITLGAKYGTAVITAKFVATGSFANSEASYRIKHVGDFVFYESFDKCDGKGGNDGSFNRTESDNVEYDNTVGWVSKTANGANKCVKIGSRNKAGSVTTPSIAVSTTCRLSFKAASWEGDNSTISVTISSGKLTYNNGEPTKTITIKPNDKEWTDYSMIVSGTKSFTVEFACPGGDNRFFLDEVMVTPQEITLDENSDNIVEAAENVNVTLKRKLIADDNWNTLCVPFNLTPEQTTKAFGADVELRTLTHAEGTTLTFGKATEIEAGKPYLIRVKEIPTDYVYKFTGVKVIASGDNWTIQNVGNVNFIGLYAPRDVTELEMLIDGGVALFLGDNNKFFRAQSGTKMGGFRAFFLVSKDTNPTNVKAVIDGVANGIEDLVIDGVKANGRVYNLNGQYVGKSLNGLQPGLYIQNGKKIVIK